MIGTHDSASGMESANLKSKLIKITSKTQNHTLCRQFDLGCRYFDIRVAKYKDRLHGAHGIWTSKKTIVQLLDELDKHICETVDKKLEDLSSTEYLDNIIRVDIALERNCQSDYEFFMREMKKIELYCSGTYKFVKLCAIAVKYNEKHDWEVKRVVNNLSAPFEHKFKNLRLEWSNPLCVIVVPSFWDKFHKWEYKPDTINSFDFLDVDKVIEIQKTTNGKLITWADFLDKV